MGGPLEGLRVLDLSRVLAGPVCSMLLGDLGADVLKVEQPGVGDETRSWGPPFTKGESAYFLAINRNKRSLTLNLKDPRGLALLTRLVQASDILIQNFRPGTLARLGLGYAEAARLNGRLIYASLTAYGSSGPGAAKPGYDFIAQGVGGLMSITGLPDGPPTKVGVAVVDVVAGLLLTGLILAALHRRERTGRGEEVETSLLQAAVALLINVASNYLVSGEVPGRWGNAHANIVPYQTFATADGHLNVAIANDGLWRTFCQIIGEAAWAEDPEFATNAARTRNRERLVPLLAARFARLPTAAWLTRLEAAGLPCGPVNTVAEVLADPAVRHLKMVQEVEHPTLGKVPLLGIPFTLAGSPPVIRRPPPRLGEHTGEVLGEVLGLSQEDVEALRREAVL
ncbi:MAG: CoA transferase [candidate division NC10 bacterium]|nr:CoA transferase [candidate division NC10 bacterium]